ncbi:hypothetical protein Efla_004275 [Eimeria flavescens]
MKFFSFITLVNVALVALRVQADESASEVKYAGNATEVDCLDVFNVARTAAGLVPFVSAGAEFSVTKQALDKSFTERACKALMTQTPLTEVSQLFDFNKTVALAIQDGHTGDCAAAVTHFNGALPLFGSLPPAFSTSEPVYKELQAVSFVALYNPKEDPKLDCGYLSCTATTKASSKGSESDGSPQEGNTTTLKGLLCATSPQALIEGQAPFVQKRYDRIKGAISSALAAVPAFLTVALAAAAIASL